MKQIVNLILLSILFLTGISIFILNENDTQVELNNEIEINKVGCGTIVLNHSAESLIEGKNLFRNTCASCHDKSMKKDMTGPKLLNCVERWNNDTTMILTYLQESSAFIDTTKFQYAIDLKKGKYKINQSHSFKNLTLTELKNLLNYIELKI